MGFGPKALHWLGNRCIFLIVHLHKKRENNTTELAIKDLKVIVEFWHMEMKPLKMCFTRHENEPMLIIQVAVGSMKTY